VTIGPSGTCRPAPPWPRVYRVALVRRPSSRTLPDSTVGDGRRVPARPSIRAPRSVRRFRARDPVTRGRRTRLVGLEAWRASPGTESGRNRSARIGRSGSDNQPRMERPSSGNAARIRSRWAPTTRRLVRPSATTTHEPTSPGSQPSDRPIWPASRARRSAVARSPPRSTSSVLISTISKVRVAGWKATRSMTPRSPWLLNETLGLDEPAGSEQAPGHGVGHGRVATRQQPPEGGVLHRHMMAGVDHLAIGQAPTISNIWSKWPPRATLLGP